MNVCDFHLTSFGLSDIGLIRSNNEDLWISIKDHHFFAIADGMGGHRAGEVAAREAVDFICRAMEEFFSSNTETPSLANLRSFNQLCIENANSWVYHLGNKNLELQGMGTTLCTLLFHKGFMFYGHVGDSRIYRYREGSLDQLTQDHSLKNELVKHAYALEKKYCYKHILTRAIGVQDAVNAEIGVASVLPNDVYLLCTDGLTDHVSDQEIKQILNQDHQPKQATKALIEKAKENGGSDNITVVSVRVDSKK